jgi:hypothetical protein
VENGGMVEELVDGAAGGDGAGGHADVAGAHMLILRWGRVAGHGNRMQV